MPMQVTYITPKYLVIHLHTKNIEIVQKSAKMVLKNSKWQRSLSVHIPLLQIRAYLLRYILTE